MRDTQLVLIEGMPGSGKSTTARAVTDRLEARGRRVVQLQEVPGERGTAGDAEHPLHVGGRLFPAGSTLGDAFFPRYTVEQFIQESLARWQALVDHALASGETYVVESYPHQSGARVLLQMDAPEAAVREHAARVEHVIGPLRPALIYLDRTDPVGAIRAIAAQRGPQWTAYVVELIGRSPYTERRGLTGMPAVEAVMAAYKATLDSLIQDTTLPKLVLSDANDWEARYRQIDAFLGLTGDTENTASTGNSGGTAGTGNTR